MGVRIIEKLLGLVGKLFVLRKEYGGLGVRQIREFNIALIGKWCWRMLVDRGGLWFRVLAAHYGMEGGRGGSSWWREIAKIRDGVGGVGGSWFEDCIGGRSVEQLFLD